MTRLRGLMMLCALVLALPAQAAQTLRLAEPPRPAPGFSLPDLQEGAVRTLAEESGKWVLVNFWATWCGPCRREMPSMQRLYEALDGERFNLLAIHVGPGGPAAERFVRHLGLTFPILEDADMGLTQWQVMGLPASFVVDPQGCIVADALGERDWDSPALRSALQALMSNEGSVAAAQPGCR